MSNFIPPTFTQPQPLPLHIITMVLNGEPFIRHHIDQFARLSIPWHWHIVEGVAALRHDTAWSLRHDGHIPEDLHHQGRSIDGTTEYLDELAKKWPQNITVYRKPPSHAWDGKIEMLATPLANIQSCPRNRVGSVSKLVGLGCSYWPRLKACKKPSTVRG